MWYKIVFPYNFSFNNFFTPIRMDENLELYYVDDEFYYNDVKSLAPFEAIESSCGLQITEINDTMLIKNFSHTVTIRIDLQNYDLDLHLNNFMFTLKKLSHQNYFKFKFHHIHKMQKPNNGYSKQCQFSIEIPICEDTVPPSTENLMKAVYKANTVL